MTTREAQQQPRAKHQHVFDPVSGWCLRCTYRDDGRLTGPGGSVWREGQAAAVQSEANYRRADDE